MDPNQSKYFMVGLIQMPIVSKFHWTPALVTWMHGQYEYVASPLAPLSETAVFPETTVFPILVHLHQQTFCSASLMLRYNEHKVGLS